MCLGASSFGSVFRTTDDSESIQVLETAVRSGVNLIDTAPWYGHGKSETVLGKVRYPGVCRYLLRRGLHSYRALWKYMRSNQLLRYLNI